jgi:hypothetical protein
MTKKKAKKKSSKKWIQGAVKRPGALTAKAKKAGMGVQEYARKHAKDKGRTGQQARLARTFKKMATKRKKS